MKKITLSLLVLCCFAFSWQSKAQSVATQTFAANGTDSSNFQLSINDSDITVNEGQPIQSVTISNYESHYYSTAGTQPCLEAYDWFYFDLDVSGGTSDGLAVTNGCEADYIGLDVSGFTNLTFTSVDADAYSDTVYLFVTLEVTYQTPSCPTPTALTATNITTGSADLGWTQTGGNTNWDIEWGAAGFTPTGTPTIDDTSNNPQNLPGLSAGTAYDFYVRADCGMDNTSDTSTWAGPFSFTTLYNPPANDECANAVSLTVNPDFACGTVTAGTVAGATDSGADDATCYGTPNNDVWYSFMATATSHKVSLTNLVGSTTDMYMTFYDATGGCGALGASIACSDPETKTLTGLTVGTTYYVQVYSYGNTLANTTFDICVGTPPPPPANDECADAVSLTVNPDYNCGTVTSGTVASATDSGANDATCYGTPNNDVWYSFMATATAHRVSLTNLVGSTTDMYMTFYDATGGCGALGTSIACSDPETANLTGLTVGTTYYVQVYSYGSGTADTTFDICVGTPPPPPPAPANDDCATAQSLVEETSIATAAAATPIAGTIEGATDSGLPAEQCGTYTGNANDDVWYSFEALTPNVNITFEINGANVFDGVAQLYSGTCGSLTKIDCADNSITTAPVVEEIQATGLTVGEVYYVRIYQYSGTSDTFGKSFDVKLWSPDALSADEFELNQFSYFPNPVNNKLSLRAQQNIQNVAVYNMLGQEVLRVAPNTVDADVDMATLQTGAYFVKVTINDRTKTVRVIKN
ncbi:MAG: T9SS type A sorting domain-containing protein [Gelidibacter sp.]